MHHFSFCPCCPVVCLCTSREVTAPSPLPRHPPPHCCAHVCCPLTCYLLPLCALPFHQLCLNTTVSLCLALSLSLSLSLCLSLLVVLGSVGVWRTGTGQDRHPRHPTAAPQTCQTPRPPLPPPRPPSPLLAPASRLTWTNGRWLCACCKDVCLRKCKCVSDSLIEEQSIITLNSVGTLEALAAPASPPEHPTGCKSCLQMLIFA